MGGSWGSWANAPVFLKAWQAVIDDGRYEHHDWVVKVDADCVFRPLHLKQHLSESQSPGIAFFKNFYPDYPVVGAIEIASREAILALANDVKPCKDMSIGAAEDDWFAKCLKQLGAVMLEDNSLLQHEDHPKRNRCSDMWWVAIHPYKDVNSYRQCEEQVPS